MYTRSFDEERVTPLPEGYSGTALREDIVPDTADGATSEVSAKPRGSILSFLPRGLGELFGGGAPFSFGMEEILIIGVAAFLFFNKSGDKECALMLLILLFVR